MLKAYKYRIYPTEEQRVLFARTFGCCRVVYNWALELQEKAYKEQKELGQKNKFLGYSYFANLMSSSLKKKRQWLNEVNSQSLQTALRNLDRGYKNFFRNPKRFDLPVKKKRKGSQSFQCVQHCSVDFKNGILNIPKVKGIKTEFHRTFRGTIKTITISRTTAFRFYASILVDLSDTTEVPLRPLNAENAIGIDMGLKSHLVCSNGEVFENHKYLRRSER